MADAARALLQRTHLSTNAATCKAGAKLGPPGSQPIIIPGPGGYSPNPMQRDMMPTQYELYPERRMELDTRVHQAATTLEAMAAQTQVNLDADRREYVTWASAKPKQFAIGAPPHLHFYKNTQHPHQTALIDTLRRSGGVGSAIYPTIASTSRPVYSGNTPLRPPRRPMTSPCSIEGLFGAPVSPPPRKPPFATDAVNRGTRLLAQVHTTARSGEPMPLVPVVAHGSRMPSAARGLSEAALRALRRFYSSHGGSSRTLRELCMPGSGSESVCCLSTHTGLSLAETLALDAEAPSPLGKTSCIALSAGAGLSGVAFETKRISGVAGLVGPATTFVRCDEPETTTIAELLDAILAKAEALDREAEERDEDTPPGGRYVWLEAFAVSQPLVHNLFAPQLCDAGSKERAAREEQPTLELVEAALESAREVFVVGGGAGGTSKSCKASPLKQEMSGQQRYLMTMSMRVAD